MSRPEHERPSVSRRAALLCCLAALAAGALLALTLSPTAPERAATPAGVGAARSQAGVRVGFPHTPKGAAAAVATFQRAFADTAILDPVTLRTRTRAVASPDYAQRMLAANAPGARRLSDGPLGAGVRLGLHTLYSAVPIGYRVLSYSPRRARVLTWGFTLLGNAASLEPTAYFGLTRTDVVWQDARWWISRSRGGFGPTPRLGRTPPRLGAYRVIDVTRGLRSYAPAP